MRLKCILIAFAASVVLSAQATAGIDIGPAVGTNIPDGFVARDATGAPVGLADIVGDKGVVLAFVRSASWCPYCQKQMIDLKAAAAPLADRGFRLAVLSYDSPAVLAAFAQKQGIGYTLLSDEKSAMIDAFGLRDPQYPPTSKAHGVPKPAIFVIDVTGVVRGKLAEDDYKVR
ncbi:MAG: peroxiredoxin family protein, partial [Rhodospirillaceae bacterium]|nr:peroxiredoxin family protein [Rhodospirillaceae bacterium]